MQIMEMLFVDNGDAPFSFLWGDMSINAPCVFFFQTSRFYNVNVLINKLFIHARVRTHT